MLGDSGEQAIEEGRGVIGGELPTQFHGLGNCRGIGNVGEEDLVGPHEREHPIHPRHASQRPARGQAFRHGSVQLSAVGGHSLDQLGCEGTDRVVNHRGAQRQDGDRIRPHRVSFEEDVESLLAGLGPGRQGSVSLDVTADTLHLEVTDLFDRCLGDVTVLVHLSETRPR